MSSEAKKDVKEAKDPEAKAEAAAIAFSNKQYYLLAGASVLSAATLIFSLSYVALSKNKAPEPVPAVASADGHGDSGHDDGHGGGAVAAAGGHGAPAAGGGGHGAKESGPVALTSQYLKAKASAVKSIAEQSKLASAALADIVFSNEQFALSKNKAYFDQFRDGQHPRVTLVTCSDSRIQTNDFSDDGNGDIFTIRNIGNQILSNEGSVKYGVHHLHTPLLVVMGHVGCGAIKAAMTDYGAEDSSIRRELDSLHLSVAHTPPDDKDFNKRWLAGVHENVHQQVTSALQDYRDLVEAGELTVVGAVYDFRNDLGKGLGKVAIVNVNGERNPANYERLSFYGEVVDEVRKNYLSAHNGGGKDDGHGH